MWARQVQTYPTMENKGADAALDSSDQVKSTPDEKVQLPLISSPLATQQILSLAGVKSQFPSSWQNCSDRPVVSRHDHAWYEVLPALRRELDSRRWRRLEEPEWGTGTPRCGCRHASWQAPRR